MPKVLKLEPRTEQFIIACENLEKKGILPSNTELAAILGIKSKSIITEIRHRRLNIQPDKWELFKKHFKLSDSGEPSVSYDNEQQSKNIGDNEAGADIEKKTTSEGTTSLHIIKLLAESHNNLTISHQSLILQNEELASANRTLAESNAKLIDQYTTASALSKITPAAQSGLNEVLAMLADVGPGKRFFSEEEAWANVIRVLGNFEAGPLKNQGTQSEKGNYGK